MYLFLFVSGDEGMKVLWKMVNDLSLAELNKMYKARFFLF